jgi:hypothetical protein
MGAVIAIFLASSAYEAFAGDGTYEVVNPTARSSVKTRSVTPSIPDLSGKTICVSGMSFRGDIVGLAVAENLKQQYPNLKIIPNTELPFGPAADVAGAKEEKLVQDIAKQKGCDAAIVGVGC